MSNFGAGVQAVAREEAFEEGRRRRRFDRGPLERLTRIGSDLFDVDLCVALMPWEPHWLRPLAERLRSAGQGFLRPFGRHDAFVVPDARACAALMIDPVVAEPDPGIRFITCASLVLDDAKGRLNLFLADREPRTWTEDRLSSFADFLELSENVLHAALIRQEITALTEENSRLRQLSMVDPLTGLWNRSSILDILQRELERCSRLAMPISLIVVDIDRFKEVNDRYGHLGGDAVLKETALRLRCAVRSYDAVGRFGGDEFLVVMSDSDEISAATVAERVQKAMRHPPVDTGEGPVPITVSQGLTTHAGPSWVSRLHLFDKADRALYLAKTRGRDRIQQDADVPPIS